MHTVQRKTFEGENVHEFRGLRATRKSFLHEILGVPYPPMIGLVFRESFLRKTFTSYRSTKVFYLESFPSYGKFRVTVVPVIVTL